jgi:hypothetical protein
MSESNIDNKFSDLAGIFQPKLLTNWLRRNMLMLWGEKNVKIRLKLWLL